MVVVMVIHQAEKIWIYDRTTARPHDRTTAQGATFNMRGQLYRGHANATALSSSPVVSALCSESEDPRRVGKKNASSAFRLG